jgi:hypothetical protein
MGDPADRSALSAPWRPSQTRTAQLLIAVGRLSGSDRWCATEDDPKGLRMTEPLYLASLFGLVTGPGADRPPGESGAVDAGP